MIGLNPETDAEICHGIFHIDSSFIIHTIKECAISQDTGPPLAAIGSSEIEVSGTHRIVRDIPTVLIEFPMMNQVSFSNGMAAASCQYIGRNSLFGEARAFPFEFQSSISSMLKEFGSKFVFSSIKPHCS